MSFLEVFRKNPVEASRGGIPFKALSGFSWFVLAWTVGVILWGAYVRATGSGAGCGDHWPLCNGQAIPRAPEIKTVIEFTHRITSGLNLLLVFGMGFWILRKVPKPHPVRRAAWASIILIIVEALIGAGLVLLGLVAKDDSTARAVVLAIHLANTFLLLGAIALTALWSRPQPIRMQQLEKSWSWGLATLLSGCMLVGVSGAITALGDTLFPETGFREGLSATSHVLLKLRLLHPMFALGFGLFSLLFTQNLAAHVNGKAGAAGPSFNRITNAFCLLVLSQLALGFLNVYLMAPVWMQMVHLLVADLIWIGAVILVAEACCAEVRVAGREPLVAAPLSESPTS